MHRDHRIFIEGITHKKKVSVTVLDNSNRKTTTRISRPLFYIPAGDDDSCAHYYLWDGEKGKRGDIYWLTPKQIINIKLTKESFDPAGFTLVDNEYLSQKSP